MTENREALPRQSVGAAEWMRHGWRGVGAAGVSWTHDSPRTNHDFAGGSWLAVATDREDDNIAVSIWQGEKHDINSRMFAFWMPREAAAALVAGLQAELEKTGPDA
jgi:hypothetical protein